MVTRGGRHAEEEEEGRARPLLYLVLYGRWSIKGCSNCAQIG